MSFGWKRKIVQVKPCPSDAFDSDSDDLDANYSGVTNFKRTKREKDINSEERFLSIKEEGVRLAEQEKFSEALDKFNRASRFKPHDATLLEMISQVQQEMGEHFCAIASAEKSVALNPTWSIGYQTLGRAHVNIGETKLALLNFSKALHLNPAAEELRNEDIPWALSLCTKSSSCVKPLAAFEKTTINIVRVRDNT